MNPQPRNPGERLPPVPPPNEGPRPIRELDPEDMPDEKRTPNPAAHSHPSRLSHRVKCLNSVHTGSRHGWPPINRATRHRGPETCALSRLAR